MSTTPTSHAWEVLEVQPVGVGALKAVAKAQIGPIVIYGIRILQQPGGQPWIALPQQALRRKSDGTWGSGFIQAIEITSAALLNQLREAVLEAWRAGR